jgi:hypothetical protein
MSVSAACPPLVSLGLRRLAVNHQRLNYIEAM